MNQDITPRSRRRVPALGRWAWIAAATLAGLFLMGLGGIAYGTYDFARDHDGRLLPGVSIQGIDVGGMTPRAALHAVRSEIDRELTRPVTVGWQQHSWQVTPAELGTRTDVEELLGSAAAASEAASFVDLARMRFLDEDLGFDREVTFTYPRRRARNFVAGIARRFERDPRDAAIDYSSGWVEIVGERTGRAVNEKKSTRALMGALREGDPSAPLAVRAVTPDVDRSAFDTVLLLRIGENRLYYYEKGTIKHEWTVATGLPEYPTPTGLYEIELKRYMPTWINPDPDGWGADMPTMIGPGISNPLGTRALNWTAPGIRFHGTTATASLGHNASHGCVRMAMSDVEFLYDIVDVGTPIVSVDVGAYSTYYDDSVVTEGA